MGGRGNIFDTTHACHCCHAVAGSPAVAHPVPHPPPFSPVRETTLERQPETEWVVPNPVSPGTDWRPWPSAPIPTTDAAGRAEDPALLTSLSAKIDRCMGRIDSLETKLGTSKKIMGGAILTLVSRVQKLERTVKQLRTARLVGDAPATEGDVDIQDEVDLEGLSRMASEALGHDQATVPSEDIEERRFIDVPGQSSILQLLRSFLLLFLLMYFLKQQSQHLLVL
ncbi:hypothetical protein Tco_0171603, partial [Tanacetum coccineum]